MDTNLQLILPTLLLPLGLSALWQCVAPRRPVLWWVLPMAWLPAYLWILGGALPLWPGEAIHWLWPLLLVSVVLAAGLSRSAPRLSLPAQMALLAAALVLIAWPVLRYEPGPALVAELLMLLGAGSGLLVLAARQRVSSPALLLALCSGGLALVTALGGSLLVGQLAAALAALLGAGALAELRGHGQIPARQLLPLWQLYLALLLIARLYAGIPLPSTLLLLVAPLLGGWLRRWPGLAAAGLGSAAALAWLLVSSDGSGYY